MQNHGICEPTHATKRERAAIANDSLARLLSMYPHISAGDVKEVVHSAIIVFHVAA